MTAVDAAKKFINYPLAKSLFPEQVKEISNLLHKYSHAANYAPKKPSYKIDLSLNDFTGGNLPQGKKSDYAIGIFTGVQALSWDNLASATGGAQYGMPVGVLPYNQYETDNPYTPKTQQEFLGSTYGLPLVTAAVGKTIPKLPYIVKGKDLASPSKFGMMSLVDGEMAGENKVVKLPSNVNLKILEEALQNSIPTKGHPHQLMHTLNDGTRVIFRKDFSEQAHPIGNIFQGKGSIDHYNIEIQIPKKNGSVRTIENLHIVPNSSGGFTWWGKDGVTKK